MYIKLGTTNLNYIKSTTNDYIILAEVVDSSLSFEKPVLVRNTDELDIWFGKEFSDRDYFIELLNSGVTLFLYKPVSDLSNSYSENYIDYSNFTVYEEIFNSEENFLEWTTINQLEESIVYRVKSLEGEKIYSGNEYGNLTIRYTEYISYQGIPTKVVDLPQNIDFTTNSINNRDTLTISKGEEENTVFASPTYCYIDNDISFLGATNNKQRKFHNINCERISSGYQTLSYLVDFKDHFLSSTRSIQYLVLTSNTGNKNALVFCNSSKDLDSDEGRKLVEYVGSEGLTILNIPENFDDRRKAVINWLVGINDLNIEFINKTSYRIICTTPYNVDYYFNLANFSLEPDFTYTNNLIYSEMFQNKLGNISFVSKTIGTGGELGNIQVSIEDLGDGYCRIILKRFEYTETYEGRLEGTVETPRIDNLINRYSKLVICKLDDSIESDYKKEKENYKFINGTWYLRGGSNESVTKEMYLKSIEILYNQPEPIYFDYLLVPDIRKFSTEDKDLGYYPEYETLLKYSKSLNNQVLIQNLDYGERLELNTFTFNYVNDKDNRLIYFYRSMKVYGETRPGYYLYLYDLLMNDIYSPSADYIIYKSPVGKDEYLDNLEDIEEKLIDRKCNYLVENNHKLYYKQYQNGKNYNTTGWMRFCLGKISRELTKNKWYILEDNDFGKIQLRLANILSGISKSFSIIKSIDLSDFKISYKEKRIELTIDTYMSDLVNNNIRIDITLNYNL